MDLIKQIFIFLLLILTSSQGISQEKLRQGGFGNFFTGPAYLNFEQMLSYLKQEAVLGESFALRNVGLMVGGQGFFMLGNKYLLGGSGFGEDFGRTGFKNGEVKISTRGGNFNLGFVLGNNSKKLSFVFGGIGGVGMHLKITNHGKSPINFDQQKPLEPGTEKEYALRGIGFEVGFGVRKILDSFDYEKDIPSGSSGGLMIGFDAGIHYSHSKKGWENINYGPPTYNPLIFYGRFTIGGGGLKF